MEDKYNKLLYDYNMLLDDYETSIEDYDKLRLEFSENTIVQSMNDMKTEYEKQIKKQKNLTNIINYININNNAIKVMINTLIESSFNVSLKNKLEFINEIVESSIKKKFDIYDMDIDL